MTAAPAATSYAISSDCMNCGICEFMCPESAILPAPRHFIVDRGRCNGCGECVPYCLVRAIIPRESLAERQGRTVKAKLRQAMDLRAD